MFARFQFHTRSIESFNLFHFTSIFTHKTTQSYTENRSNLQWKNLAGDQLFFKTMIENSYNFRKHSFGTSLLARELSGTGRLRDLGSGTGRLRDPGPGIWGIWDLGSGTGRLRDLGSGTARLRDPGPGVWGICFKLWKHLGRLDPSGVQYEEDQTRGDYKSTLRSAGISFSYTLRVVRKLTSIMKNLVWALTWVSEKFADLWYPQFDCVGLLKFACNCTLWSDGS